MIATGLVISDLAYAQSSAITNTHFALQEAKEYLANGEIDKAVAKLQTARDNIDKAIENEKTSGKSKTWNYRGDTYKEYLNVPQDKIEMTYMEAGKIAVESYNTAIKLDDSKRGDYKGPAQSGKAAVYPMMFNQGIAFINDGNFDGAMEAFDIVLLINPTDSNASLNAGLAAERKPDMDRAIQYYGQMIYQQGVKDPYPYVRVAAYYTDKEEYDKGLELIQKGLPVAKKQMLSAQKKYGGMPAGAEKEKYKTEVVDKWTGGVKDLQTTEFNIYLKADRLDEAMANLQSAIETDPENDGNYSRLGQLYDQNGDTENAMKYYGMAIEKNPDNLDANYNIGAFYFNRGAEKIQATRDMDLKTYQSEGKAMEDEAVEDLKKAKPYFEKVEELQPGVAKPQLDTINNILASKGG